MLCFLAFACTAIATVLIVVYIVVKRRGVIGIIHPYCASGGGGERVLWVAVKALHDNCAKRIVIYTGDLDVTVSDMRSRAFDRFGICVPNCIELCYIRSRWLLEPRLYPVATLFGQAVASVLVGFECLIRQPPEVWIDTTGLAFTFPLAWLCGCRIGAYVHYPIISTDMIKDLSKASFNNRTLFVRSKFAATCKLLYYRAFAIAYGWAGRCAKAVATNSSWTRSHIEALWQLPNIQTVFPPCDTDTLISLSNFVKPIDSITVVSLAQFRPEKNHELQLEAWALLPSKIRQRASLVVAGAVRHQDDDHLLSELRSKCSRLGLDDSVSFFIGASRSDILSLMRKAHVGLHTMRLEHFGIAIVEMMASAVVPVAHASGGPLLDIVGDKRDRGLLADSPQEYADALTLLLSDATTRTNMAKAGQRFVKTRFSDAAFASAFVGAMRPILPITSTI
mmetsp:Transcript_21244/g.32583  ORF Transcript_21244/g.32583 Transcript_21244/m.32583 type:complete len:450 (+) Transcript_21244:39-1388(+)